MAENPALRFIPRLEQHGVAGIGTSAFLGLSAATKTMSGDQFSYWNIWNFDIVPASSSGPTDRSELRLDDKLYYTNDDSRDSVFDEFFTITVGTNITTPHSNASYRIWMETAPELFTPTFFPGFPIADDLFELYAENIPSTSDIWQLTEGGSGKYKLVFPIDLNKILIDSTGDTLNAHVQLGSWNGRIIFDCNPRPNQQTNTQLRFADTGVLEASMPYISTITGWDGFGPERGRPVIDMRSGLPAFAEDLVEDGYSPGIWTSSANWDPIDPRDVHPVEFPPNEGVKKDDVPV